MQANLAIIPDHEFDDLDATLEWGEPRTQTSKAGRTFTVCEAEATHAFWRLWKLCKQCAIDAGYRVFKVGDAWRVSRLASRLRSTGARPRVVSDIATPAERAPARDGRVSSPVCARGNHSLPVPVPVGKVLLDYQLHDVREMAAMGSVLLAHEQGLGKTIMVAALCNAVRARSVLIVAPARTLANWSDELSAWLVTPAEPLLLTSANAHAVRAGMVIVASYETAARCAPALRGLLWDVLAFDECHAFGNHESQRTVELIGEQGALQARHRVCMSGTPFKNRPIELWPVLRFLEPERWHSRHEYGVRYCRAYFDRDAQAWDYRGSSNLDELRAILLETVMLRRMKAEVLRLPPIRHELIVIPPDATQAALLKREAEFSKMGRVDPDDIARSLSAGEIDPDEHLSRVRAELAESKLPAIVAHAEDIMRRGEKLVLFVHHKAVVDALVQRWRRHAIKIVGGQTPAQTAAAVRAFQTEPHVLVCIASIRAAGAGLTLTAARRVLFGECDWAPASMDQAAARCHRIGQTRDVLVEHVVLDGSLDAIMYGINARKRRSAKAVFN